jgi:hypothetical protein
MGVENFCGVSKKNKRGGYKYFKPTPKRKTTQKILRKGIECRKDGFRLKSGV